MSTRLGVELTDEQHQALSKIARKRGIAVSTLIEQLVAHALQPTPAMIRQRLSDEVRKLHATGRNDRLIAENLGIPRPYASRLRNEMKLPANDPRGWKPKQKASTTT
ncbi:MULTISPECIES: hypothetical protein [unclassified Cryobacterium]|uniref:hypothetical protein n=1 Tax=unclassified Cryobacterium TaxID=2649013 RepID=UPI002AB359FD|nr:MULTISPECIES: hypothetical protein [unclassified Cryobacterium]MDY7542632.1 hypothetical protein [Cryobacterium sp. 5B3]MEB0264752.1 hypothetical protein [Cryobacterium sp. 10I5]MEB0273724.1 hypothetical protein [Cryobacterium sp. 5B3]